MKPALLILGGVVLGAGLTVAAAYGAVIFDYLKNGSRW